ncbi:hypothetical protein Q9233_017457 [Columba guinea]|nr:hypothetical protein Q9233_017457 [Columba guinea]
MSGTKVVADKPVARLHRPHLPSGGSAIATTWSRQLLPVSAWGKTFIVPPLPFETQSDIVYVSTAQPAHVESQHGAAKTARSFRPNRSRSTASRPPMH